MRTFDVINLLDSDFAPASAKIHLATSNGSEDPLTLFRAGHFERWQAWQNRRNFERDYVVALIAMGNDRWLFGGLYRSLGCAPAQGPKPGFEYDLEERPNSAELKGRLVSRFERPGRQAYLNGEAWIEHVTVAELLAERLTIGDFPGFKEVFLSKLELDAVVRHGTDSWRAALSSVSGVYLVSDEVSGRLYVGSATGEGGFWRRWSEYAATGHAGNVDLRCLLDAEGADRCSSFRFSILEVADLSATVDHVLAREAHWKRVLCSRTHGLNAN